MDKTTGQHKRKATLQCTNTMQAVGGHQVEIETDCIGIKQKKIG